MGYTDANELFKMLRDFGNVTVRIGTTDYNEWESYRRAWGPAWRVCFSLASGFVSAIALAKLIAYVRAFGVQLSVPQLSLLMIYLVTMFRTIYHAIDPIFFQTSWNYLVSLSLLTISFPFELLNVRCSRIHSVTTVLLTLFFP